VQRAEATLRRVGSDGRITYEAWVTDRPSGGRVPSGRKSWGCRDMQAASACTPDPRRCARARIGGRVGGAPRTAGSLAAPPLSGPASIWPNQMRIMNGFDAAVPSSTRSARLLAVRRRCGEFRPRSPKARGRRGPDSKPSHVSGAEKESPKEGPGWRSETSPRHDGDRSDSPGTKLHSHPRTCLPAIGGPACSMPRTYLLEIV
jgi:hypothetical protein